MARTPTFAGRFGGQSGVRSPSVPDWSHVDRHTQQGIDRKVQVMKARIAFITLAIVALIALTLATRVAAAPVDGCAHLEQPLLGRLQGSPTCRQS